MTIDEDNDSDQVNQLLVLTTDVTDGEQFFDGPGSSSSWVSHDSEGRLSTGARESFEAYRHRERDLPSPSHDLEKERSINA